MRIDNNNRVGAANGTRSERARSAGRNGATRGVREPADTLSIMGIPPDELTPKVREAIMTLMAEVDRLRKEVEEQRARVSHFEQLADEDTLTPLVNRRAFVRELSRVVSSSERYGTPASVIYFDLDGLKGINDTYGHAAGDAAIQQIAAVLMTNVRESDVVGRLGGDEFGVLLTHADEKVTMEKAVQLARIIRERPLDWEDAQIELHLAYGVHSFKGGEDARAALDAADRAMYARKNAAKATVAG